MQTLQSKVEETVELWVTSSDLRKIRPDLTEQEQEAIIRLCKKVAKETIRTVKNYITNIE